MVLIIEMVLFCLLLCKSLCAVLITEYTTIRDVIKWKDCKKLTAAEINTFLDPFHCRGFKADCLMQFDVSEINGACKDHLMPSEVKKLTPLKYKELIESDNVANIGCLTENFGDFADHFESYPFTYSYYCSHDDNWRRKFAITVNMQVLKTKQYAPPMLMAFLVQAENVPQLGPEFFRVLGPNTRNFLPAWVIKLLSKEQFGYLRMSDWNQDRIKAVPPEYMDNFTNAPSIPYWSIGTLNSLTVEQVSNWGKCPSKLPPKGRFARRTFYLAHPCTYLKSILDRFHDDDVVKAIEGRCKPLWKQRDFLKADIRHKKYRRWEKNNFRRS